MEVFRYCNGFSATFVLQDHALSTYAPLGTMLVVRAIFVWLFTALAAASPLCKYLYYALFKYGVTFCSRVALSQFVTQFERAGIFAGPRN
jgi:hypothetical protein